MCLKTLLLGLALTALACPSRPRDGQAAPRASSAAPTEATAPPPSQEDLDPPAFRRARARMVETQMRDVQTKAVLDALRRVPRHRFVPEAQASEAYEDYPLPIGYGQTISQPYIVALMTELASVGPGDRVLEVGTGSGYQAAVLAELGAEVYTIEIVEPLARQARARLRELGYGRVHVRAGDGYAGWPEAAPFSAIVVTAAPDEVPEPLRAQVAVGGRIVIPVGGQRQVLRVLTRTPEGFEERSVIPVRFVPMTGEAER